MGWCSGTDIMDAAVKAAEAAVWDILSGYEQGSADSQAIRRRMDEALRPFVTAVAKELRDGDWDCIEESTYFDRFQQEMLGYSDREYEQWLGDQLHDEDDIERRMEIVRRLSALHEKMDTPERG